MPCWFWGGDPDYLAYWMRQSGLADILSSLRRELVYVGVSAGSMAVASTFGETYCEPSAAAGAPSRRKISCSLHRMEKSVEFSLGLREQEWLILR
jgi:hypothetical protein